LLRWLWRHLQHFDAVHNGSSLQVFSGKRVLASGYGNEPCKLDFWNKRVLVVGPTAPIIIVAYCGSFQDFQRFTKHMMQQACTYYVWVQGLSSPICAGAGAYAFENVRTSVEHGCRHVGLPERRALEKSQKRGLDYFRLVDGV
jgi:hypothetical protein